MGATADGQKQHDEMRSVNANMGTEPLVWLRPSFREALLFYFHSPTIVTNKKGKKENKRGWGCGWRVEYQARVVGDS